MSTVDKDTVLAALKRHETLTVNDLAKEENLGFKASPEELKGILEQLSNDRLIKALDNVNPATYTITNQGINVSAS